MPVKLDRELQEVSGLDVLILCKLDRKFMNKKVITGVDIVTELCL